MSTISVSTVSTLNSNTPLLLNTGNSDAGNIKIESSNTDIQINGNMKTNNMNVFSAISSSFDKANSALSNTSGVTFDGNLNITGNLNIGVTSSGIKLSVFGSSNSGITTVTDNTSIVLDMTSNNNFAITLGGSNTFINPTTMNPGQSGVIWISQGNVGGRAPSWGSYWKFPSNTAPTLTSAANSVDAVVYIVRNSTSITVQAILNVG
jgi:hypothetical protein